jgi:hypothetical protein
LTDAVAEEGRIKLSSLTLRSAGPDRGDCAMEGTVSHPLGRRLGTAERGPARCESGGKRSLGIESPGHPEGTSSVSRDIVTVMLPGEGPVKEGGAFAEQVSVSERSLGRRTSSPGRSVGPDRKGGPEELAAPDTTRSEGEVEREPGTAVQLFCMRDTGKHEAEPEHPRDDEPENPGEVEAPCAHSSLCGPPSEPPKKPPKTVIAAAGARESPGGGDGMPVRAPGPMRPSTWKASGSQYVRGATDELEDPDASQGTRGTNEHTLTTE